MKKGSFAMLGVAVLLAVTTAATPSFALGDCGPNRHRNGYGQCVFGGQNQHYCLRRTGHTAQGNGHGQLVCR